jgi:hypothetical protein
LTCRTAFVAGPADARTRREAEAEAEAEAEERVIRMIKF